METVIRSDVYITQSIDHSAITISNGYQCKYANFARTMANSAFSRTNVNECKEADSTHSTGQGASSNSNVNERKWADFAYSTGHSASSNIKPEDANEGKNEDSASTTHSDIFGNIDGQVIDPTEGTESEACLSLLLPTLHNVDVGIKTTPERYLENLHLLGLAWVEKVKHIACLTLSKPRGPVYPEILEPTAKRLFKILEEAPDPGKIRRRADFADEIDIIWRVKPDWLPHSHGEFLYLWEYVTGIVRTWGWNCHNEPRRRGAPEHLRRMQDQMPRTRFFQNTTPATAYHHILKYHNIPPIEAFIRKNKFYRVGDDMTACILPEPSPLCHHRCIHRHPSLRKENLIDWRSRCRHPRNHSPPQKNLKSGSEAFAKARPTA